jgi:hypothetical protein
MKNHRLATAAGAPATPTPPVTRCEGCIRIAKVTGLANLPLKSIAASVALASMARRTAYPNAYPNRVVFAPIRRCPPSCPPLADLHRRTPTDLGGRVPGA